MAKRAAHSRVFLAAAVLLAVGDCAQPAQVCLDADLLSEDGSASGSARLSLLQTVMFARTGAWRQEPAPAAAENATAETVAASHAEPARERREQRHDGHLDEEPVTKLDTALGGSMMGAITFIMSLFYLVNHYDQDIRRAAYNMTSNTISIFCAVLSYSTVTGVIFDGHMPLWAGFGILAFLFFAVQLILPMLHDHVSLEGMTILGGHMVGFAAADAFGMVQLRAPFSNNPAVSLLPVGLAVLTIGILDRLVKFTIHRLRGAHRLTHEEKEDRIEHIIAREHFEDDSLGFCVGFLLSQAAKFQSCGKLEHLHDSTTFKSAAQVLRLASFSGLFLALLVFATLLASVSHHRGWHMSRKIVVLQLIASMSAAWTFLFMGEWQFMSWYPEASPMRAVMLLALIGTFIAMAAIFVLDFVADYDLLMPKALRAIISCISIAVGLSWEKAFHGAQHSITAGMPRREAEMANLVISAAMVIIVLPAWRLFILPASLECEEHDDAISTPEDSDSCSASYTKDSRVGSKPLPRGQS